MFLPHTHISTAVMAVDLINYQKLIKHTGLYESAGSDEMKNIEEQLIRILQSHNHQIQTNVSKHFASKQTGHARFRRAPSPSSVQSEPVQSKSNPKSVEPKKKIVEESKNIDSANSSGSSSITGGGEEEEGTVSNGKPLLSTPAPCTFSSGKPPLPTSHRKRCRVIEFSQGLFAMPSSSRDCHCCKRRKTEIKRVNTTSGSAKVAADDIPADEYSWKKYDQKLIPGTLFRRGYYKCNSVKGCPARKHVERDSNDPTVLILIYEGEHRHHHRSYSRPHHNRWMKMPESLTRADNNNTTSGVGICYPTYKRSQISL